MPGRVVLEPVTIVSCAGVERVRAGVRLLHVRFLLLESVVMRVPAESFCSVVVLAMP